MRVLIVGAGARGLKLTERLSARGDATRVVTRKPERRAEIEAAGGEYFDGDPDRIGTLRYACENVTVLVWALGTASGDTDERLAALHGSRLSMMLERTIDTTVRGVLYEAVGFGPNPLPSEWFAEGRAVVERLCIKNEIPFLHLEVDGSDADAWAAAAEAAILELVARDRG